MILLGNAAKALRFRSIRCPGVADLSRNAGSGVRFLYEREYYPFVLHILHTVASFWNHETDAGRRENQ